MRRAQSAQIATVGVTQVRLAIEKLKWLFRDQPGEDYGIDAQVEIVEDNVVAGKLLALQIKSGLSYFAEHGADGWWYRPDANHVRYWLNHSLPVVIVLVHPETERCFWELVTEKTLVKTSGKDWKVLVPEHQILDESAKDALRRAAEGDPYLLRVRAMALDRPWMQLLAEENRVVIDIEEWINKTSGRGSITLGVDNEDGRPPNPMAQWSVLLGFADYSEAIPKLFPWADVSLHEETYQEADRDLYETECVVWDEGDRFFIQEFDEWMRSRELPKLRPYRNQAGEVALWRLELTLNDLGSAFLVVDKFATGDSDESS